VVLKCETKTVLLLIILIGLKRLSSLAQLAFCAVTDRTQILFEDCLLHAAMRKLSRKAMISCGTISPDRFFD
jgi:hypothetical protein